MTSIEWTDETWNPIVGCSRVSAGCVNCYAEKVAHRGMSPQHRGLTVLGAAGVRWTGEVRLVESALAKPLGWKKPRRVFVNSMSDLFHEALRMQDVARIFATMALAPRHTFQVLTKRPQRMRDLLTSGLFWADFEAACAPGGWDAVADDAEERRLTGAAIAKRLPNVWLGVSVEDQAAADERIPLLLETPAAVRFVSYEPALGPVTFDPAWLAYRCRFGHSTHRRAGTYRPGECARTGQFVCGAPLVGGVDWVIVGGESGPKARPFAIEWAARTVDQCRAAGVPVFVKQLGALTVTEERPGTEPGTWGWSYPRWADRKGGDMDEWTGELARLRVREFPEVRP